MLGFTKEKCSQFNKENMEDLTNISQDGEFEMSIGHFPNNLINKKFFDKENNNESI